MERSTYNHLSNDDLILVVLNPCGDVGIIESSSPAVESLRNVLLEEDRLGDVALLLSVEGAPPAVLGGGLDNVLVRDAWQGVEEEVADVVRPEVHEASQERGVLGQEDLLVGREDGPRDWPGLV